MDRKSTLIIAVIIFIAIAGFIVVSFQKSVINSEVSSPQIASTTWENTPAEKMNDLRITPQTIVTAKHLYLNGVHTFAGEVPLPSQCHILGSHISASKDKSQIFIALTSSTISSDECAPLITPARFKLTIPANKNSPMFTTFNGQEITLNLIEASPDDNLNNFELYIKG